MRLDKYVASSAFQTRTSATKMIASGRVTVNGVVIKNGKTSVTDRDKVALDGTLLSYSEFVYLMLCKPAGYITATEDARRGEPVVNDLIPDEIRHRGVFPVGRLDRDTTGLLIITDDGTSAHRALSPKHHVAKTYRFECFPALSDGMRSAIEAGVDIGERDSKGQTVLTAPAVINGNEITVTEGKFHQIKRMFSAVGAEITSLRRVAFAGIALDPTLPDGSWRYLTDEEIALFTGKKEV